jgi:hypothetical protein
VAEPAFPGAYREPTAIEEPTAADPVEPAFGPVTAATSADHGLADLRRQLAAICQENAIHAAHQEGDEDPLTQASADNRHVSVDNLQALADQSAAQTGGCPSAGLSEARSDDGQAVTRDLIDDVLPNMDDEDSINAYMSQLMQRVGASSFNPQITVSAPKSPKAPKAESPQLTRPARPVPAWPSSTLSRTETESGSPRVSPEVKPAVAGEPNPTPLQWPLPKAKAPLNELSHLNAFRDVANHNARTAITMHSIKQARQAILIRLAIAFFAVAVAIIVSTWSKSLLSPLTLLAAVCLGGAGYAMFNAVQLFVQARSGKKPTPIDDTVGLATVTPVSRSLANDDLSALDALDVDAIERQSEEAVSTDLRLLDGLRNQ